MVACAGVLVALWLVALTVVDLREMRLPNALTLPGAAVVLTIAAGCGRGLPALAGAAALAGCYLLIHLLSPAGMGAGDVKLALGTGALTGALGPLPWMVAAIGAPVLTVLFAIASRRRTLPHGPAMCAATALVMALAPVQGAVPDFGRTTGAWEDGTRVALDHCR
ncbi:MAG: A24 family peptidase [Mycobacterium sp.]